MAAPSSQALPPCCSRLADEASSACRCNHFFDAVLAKGGIPRMVATGMWCRDEVETLRKPPRME